MKFRKQCGALLLAITMALTSAAPLRISAEESTVPEKDEKILTAASVEWAAVNEQEPKLEVRVVPVSGESDEGRIAPGGYRYSLVVITGEGSENFEICEQKEWIPQEGESENIWDITTFVQDYIKANIVDGETIKRVGETGFTVMVQGFVTGENGSKIYSYDVKETGSIWIKAADPAKPNAVYNGRNLVITLGANQIGMGVTGVEYTVRVRLENEYETEASGYIPSKNFTVAGDGTATCVLENVLWGKGDYEAEVYALAMHAESERTTVPFTNPTDYYDGNLTIDDLTAKPTDLQWGDNFITYNITPGMVENVYPDYEVEISTDGGTTFTKVNAFVGVNYITGEGAIWQATDFFTGDNTTYQFRVRAVGYTDGETRYEGEWSDPSPAETYTKPEAELPAPSIPETGFVTWGDGTFALNISELEVDYDYRYVLKLMREETIQEEGKEPVTLVYCEGIENIWPNDIEHMLTEIPEKYNWIYNNEGGLYYFTLQAMSNNPYERAHSNVYTSEKYNTQMAGPTVTVDEQEAFKVTLSAPEATAFEWELYRQNTENNEYQHEHGEYITAENGEVNLDLYQFMYENTGYLLRAIAIVENEEEGIYRRSSITEKEWNYTGHAYSDITQSGILTPINAGTIELGDENDNYALSFQSVQGQFGDETRIWYEYGLVYTKEDKSKVADIGADIVTNSGDYHEVTVISDEWRNPGTGVVRADFFTDNFEENGTYYVCVRACYDTQGEQSQGEWSGWACIDSYTNPKDEENANTYLNTPENIGSWSAEREGYFNFNVGDNGLTFGNRYRVKLLYSADGQEFGVADRRVFNNTWDGIERMKWEFSDYADQFFNNISWQQGIYKIAVQAVSQNPYETAHGQWVESKALDVRLAAPEITVPGTAEDSQFIVSLAAEGATGFEWELYKGEVNNQSHVYSGYADAESGAAEIDLYHCMYEAANYILVVRSVKGERRSEDEISNWIYAGHAFLSSDIALTKTPTFVGWSKDDRGSLQFQAAVGEFENYIEYKYELKHGEQLATAVDVEVLPQAWRDAVTGVVNYEYFKDNYTESGTYWARVKPGYWGNDGYVTNEGNWSEWVEIGPYVKPDNTLPAPAATGGWSAEAGKEGIFEFDSSELEATQRYRLLLWYKPEGDQTFKVCDGNIFRETWDESGDALTHWLEENALIFKENYISRNSGSYYYTLQSLSDTPDTVYHSPLTIFAIGTYVVAPPEIVQNDTVFTVSASNVWGYWWDLVRIKDENGDDTEGYYSNNKYVEANGGTAELDLSNYLWDKGTYELRVRSNGVDTNNKYEFTFGGKTYLDKEDALVTPGQPQWRYHDDSDNPNPDTMFLEYYVNAGMFNGEVSYEVQLEYTPANSSETKIIDVLFGNGADYATGVGGSYNIISNFVESGSYKARARVRVGEYIAEEGRYVESFSAWSAWSDDVEYIRPSEQLTTPEAGTWSSTIPGLIEFGELPALAEGERYQFIWYYQTDIGEEEQLRNWYSYGYEDTNGAADVLNWINDRQEEILWNNGIHRISVQKMSSNPYTVASGEVHISAEYDNRAEARIAGATASLEGNIVLNFYVKVKDGISADSLFVDMFRCEVGSEGEYYILLRENVELAEEPFDVNSGCYVVSCPIAAKEMTDVIKVNLRVDKGENETYEIDHIDYSVKQYAEDVLSRTEDDNTIELVKAMLNYGAYAQKYFGYKYSSEDVNAADGLANAVNGMTEEDKNEAVNINEAELITQLTSAGHVRKVTNTPAVTGLTYYGSTANMESDTGMVHMFSLGGSSAIGDYTFTCDKELDTFSYRGNYCVEIENILAQDLDEKKTITVTDKSGNTMTIDYSIYAYINNILGKASTGEEMANLAKALYLYGEAANAYVASSSAAE